MRIQPEQYYISPAQEVFDEVKRASIELWSTYNDDYGYATEKIGKIKDLQNIRDNAAYMVAMFDRSNQIILLNLVETPEARKFVEDLIY